jgi:hypothetical protein
MAGLTDGRIIFCMHLGQMTKAHGAIDLNRPRTPWRRYRLDELVDVQGVGEGSIRHFFIDEIPGDIGRTRIIGPLRDIMLLSASYTLGCRCH